jgi:hypothetical protein
MKADIRETNPVRILRRDSVFRKTRAGVKGGFGSPIRWANKFM